MSSAAHPGFTKTNLRLSGPSQGRQSPTLFERFYRSAEDLAPFAWQEIDDGILPALYAAVSAGRRERHVLRPTRTAGGGGGGVALAKIPDRAKDETDCRRLSEASKQLPE